MSSVRESVASPEDLGALYDALDRVQAIIEFDLEGRILKANQNFLSLFGYEWEEIAGQHHRMFCDPVFV